MKLSLNHWRFCEGCEHMIDLETLGGHYKCKLYKRVMLPDWDLFHESKGLGYFRRLDACLKENEPVPVSQSG